jgi:hypothetical protein
MISSSAGMPKSDDPIKTIRTRSSNYSRFLLFRTNCRILASSMP